MSDRAGKCEGNGRDSAINRRSFLVGSAVGAAAVTLAGPGDRPALAADVAPARGIKLLRFGEYRREKPGVELADGTRLDVSEFISDFGRDFFANGGLDRVRQVARPEQCPKIPPGARLGPPVATPNQFYAIGLNYKKHIQEVGAKTPAEPEVFVKMNSCICGPTDDIIRPRASEKLDYEAELAFVIKERVSYLGSPADSLPHIAGFLICNDVSEREFQQKGSQWNKGKGAKHFGPLGPYLVPTEEVGDPQTLDIVLKVNGQVRQNSNTSDMLFNVAHLLWYLSQFFVLEAGDIVTTGTPQGVASGMKPPVWLKPGDVVETTLAKLGTQRNTVQASA
jgi:2,4-didehydro-3-deoxy-L-rhamnonate hydrolase